MKLSPTNDLHNLVTDETVPPIRRGTPLGLAAGFWINIVLSVAVVLRRLIETRQSLGLAFWIGFSINTG